MAKLSQLKRLTAEDFDKKDRELINRLAFVLNPFLTAITNALNKNLSIDDNINISYQDIQFTAPITPTSPITVLSPFNVPVRGLEIIRVDNLDSPTAVLSSAPFLEFINGDGRQITIRNSLGFTAGVTYKVRVLLHP